MDDNLVALKDPVWLKEAFDTLSLLFDRAKLHAIFGKTVRMICRPCCAGGNQLEAE